MEVPSASQFLEHAAREHFDAFIILLNNIIPDTGELFPCNLEDDATFPAVKVDQALQFLSFLKQKYHKPVLALAAWWPKNWDVAAEVKKHALDYFSFLPTEGKSLTIALERCLEDLESVKRE